MELLLTHARDLADGSHRARPARWPRPFNLLAGELWLEVDRYEDARAAFERAVRADARHTRSHRSASRESLARPGPARRRVPPDSPGA